MEHGMMFIKREYSTPQINCVAIDNEISLALESDPPTGANESLLISPQYLKVNPFSYFDS